MSHILPNTSRAFDVPRRSFLFSTRLRLTCLLLAGLGFTRFVSAEDSQTILKPRLAGDYVNIYQPVGDVFPGPSTEELEAGKFYKEWVPNDHCFVRSKSGRWHSFGITHPRTSLDRIHDGEVLSFHALAPEGPLSAILEEGSWEDQPKVLPPSQRPGEPLPNHAPYIIRREGLFHMIYGPTPMRLAVSEDLNQWTPKGNLENAPEGRDPSIFIHDGTYYLVVCDEGKVHVSTSTDFKSWKRQGVIVEMPEGTDPESPSIIQLGDRFYLFVCGWDGNWDKKELQGAYQHKTYVYMSRNPLLFEQQIAVLDAHAPEIFQDEVGDWFISSAEWPYRGVSIAPLAWDSIPAPDSSPSLDK
ncbi:MAG: family 43 glycosylhydrolase [Roseibacillus sp.]